MQSEGRRRVGQVGGQVEIDETLLLSDVHLAHHSHARPEFELGGCQELIELRTGYGCAPATLANGRDIDAFGLFGGFCELQCAMAVHEVRVSFPRGADGKADLAVTRLELERSE